jgi:DNA-binding IclR family transcriptional regulator
MSEIKSGNLQLLERTIAILDYISAEGRACSLKEIVGATGISKPSVHRVLSTLNNNLLVIKDEYTRYRMGPRVLRWAQACKGNSELLTISAPFLKRIWDSSGETIHLVSYENGRAYYLFKRESRHPLQMRSRKGDMLLLHSTGAGKAILFSLPKAEFEAFLSTTRLEKRTPHTITDPEVFFEQRRLFQINGFCQEIQENEVDIRCIAAPILNNEGYPMGAVSITCPIYRCSDEKAEELGRLLAEVLPELSSEFGYSGNRQ